MFVVKVIVFCEFSVNIVTFNGVEVCSFILAL